MPCYDNDLQQAAAVRASAPVTRPRDCSYVSCSLIVYQDGGGGGGGGDDGGGGGVTNDGGDGADEVSARSVNCNGYDEDNSSWSEEYALSSYAATSVSSDSGDGWSGDDDGRTSSSSSTGSGGGSSGKETRDAGGPGNKSKWLKSLWTLVDRMDERRARKEVYGKRSPQPVKTILRPPTTYKYVIGMSGCPSKVAVYPKRM